MPNWGLTLKLVSQFTEHRNMIALAGNCVIWTHSLVSQSVNYLFHRTVVLVRTTDHAFTTYLCNVSELLSF